MDLERLRILVMKGGNRDFIADFMEYCGQSLMICLTHQTWGRVEMGDAEVRFHRQDVS